MGLGSRDALRDAVLIVSSTCGGMKALQATPDYRYGFSSKGQPTFATSLTAPRLYHQAFANRRPKSFFCQANSETKLNVPEPYRGPNSPVSGFKLWLPGGGLVHVHASVDPSAVIEAAAVVHEGARISKDSRVGSSSVVGPGVLVGESTWIGFQVALQSCSVGANCVLHNGVKIGERGFVFWESSDGALHQDKEDQAFRAEIRDRVEIGANSVVDRGSWRDTVIDEGAKLDSLVHIGHDSYIGRSSMICSHASVGASSSLGDDVVLGSRAAVKDHVSVAAKTRIAAKSGVVRDIVEAGDYAGHPAMQAKEYKQQVASAMSGKVQTPKPQRSGATHQPHLDEFSTVT